MTFVDFLNDVKESQATAFVKDRLAKWCGANFPPAMPTLLASFGEIPNFESEAVSDVKRIFGGDAEAVLVQLAIIFKEESSCALFHEWLPEHNWPSLEIPVVTNDTAALWKLFTWYSPIRVGPDPFLSLGAAPTATSLLPVFSAVQQILRPLTFLRFRFGMQPSRHATAATMLAVGSIVFLILSPYLVHWSGREMTEPWLSLLLWAVAVATLLVTLTFGLTFLCAARFASRLSQAHHDGQIWVYLMPPEKGPPAVGRSLEAGLALASLIAMNRRLGRRSWWSSAISRIEANLDRATITGSLNGDRVAPVNGNTLRLKYLASPNTWFMAPDQPAARALSAEFAPQITTGSAAQIIMCLNMTDIICFLAEYSQKMPIAALISMAFVWPILLFWVGPVVWPPSSPVWKLDENNGYPVPVLNDSTDVRYNSKVNLTFSDCSLGYSVLVRSEVFRQRNVPIERLPASGKCVAAFELDPIDRSLAFADQLDLVNITIAQIRGMPWLRLPTLEVDRFSLGHARFHFTQAHAEKGRGLGFANH